MQTKLVLGDLSPIGTYAWTSIGGPKPQRDLSPIRIQTKTYMRMYSIIFMSDVFILWVILLDVLVCIRVLMEKSLCIFLSFGCMC
jgi:hypothetical protein